MIDYRFKEHRAGYFKDLYLMSLQHRVMPGLVYLYMPELAAHYNWDAEQRLWFAVINGCTQNPITSLRIFNKSPEIPRMPADWRALDEWFNAEWATLQFDTDRVKNKRNTLKALHSYSLLASAAGSQVALWSNKTYQECWDTATQIFSFGRLSAFSYLEYVRIMGFGAACTDLMFEDFDGSRSHRNGALFLQGMDHLVFDKRAGNGFDGKYENFTGMCGWLRGKSDQVLGEVNHPDAGYFTLESQYCQFKNGFFSRRYPGVYADMAHERIQWYDERDFNRETEPFKAIRAAHLPDWLRADCEVKKTPRANKAKMFAETGRAYRLEHFITE
jgi:hypothetical protein